jgi:glycerol kinase
METDPGQQNSRMGMDAMGKVIAAIDQGTTSTRCILFNHDSEIVAIQQLEHKQIYPQPGWVEHDPLEIWENTKRVFLGAITKADLTFCDIHAIGITNQRETTFVWNRVTGKPYCNAIVWQDTRTAGICTELATGFGQDRFRLKTGLPLATYFSGPKIQWLLQNNPEIAADARNGNVLFGTSDSWLIWNLTGGVKGGIHLIDVTNASRTLLMDLNTLKWDQEILDVMGIPVSMLPKIVPSSQVYGNTSADYGSIPVASDLGDQQAAIFGQTCFEPGEVKNTYGTGCFMLMNTGNRPIHSQNGLLTTLGYQIGSEESIYCLEGSIAMAGAIVQWLRDNLHIIQKSTEIEALASSVEDNGGVYFVPAFSGLFAPYWRSDARGIIAGLTRYATSGHIARAALEATAYQTREVLEAMEQDSRIKIRSVRVDGGMVVNPLLMQFQADLLQTPVIRPKVAETTALGAAYAAGLATGFWSNLAELKSYWKKDIEWQPSKAEDEMNKLYQNWKKAVQRTFNWIE